MQKSDRRTNPRINISFPVECRRPADKSYFYTVCKDLSVGGTKILSDKFMPKGKKIDLNINLVDNVVDLKAKVAWCVRERMADRYAMGMEFIEVNEDNRARLSGLLGKIYPGQ